MKGQRKKATRVWDLPTRVFHWTLVVMFAFAFLTSDDDHWALLHVTAGFSIAGLLIFRLIWGVAGTRHALFSDFLKPPSEVICYLRQMVRGVDHACAGHNPAGGISILLLLLSGLVATLSGILIYEDVDWPMLEEIHEGASNLMLLLVALHILGVGVSSLVHRQNLVASMITGLKSQHPGAVSVANHRKLGIILGLGVIAFWVWSLKDKLHSLI
jgi:cytochrome b